MRRFAMWLLKARQARNWSQPDLAHRSGVAQTTISRIERGGAAKPATIRKLADALGRSHFEAFAAAADDFILLERGALPENAADEIRRALTTSRLNRATRALLREILKQITAAAEEAETS